SVWENAQPTFRSTPSGSLALGHNGNLINTLELATMVEGAEDAWHGPVGTSDTDVLSALFADLRGDSVADSALAALPLVRGAFSLVFMDEHTLYAARDPQGFRPRVSGRRGRGGAVASEPAALDIIGAVFEREVEPGELITIDERGVTSATFAPPRPRGCLFEYVYLARPDTTIAGRSVQAARVEVGRRLAAEHPAEADLVIPVPESGTPAAIGYAQASGIPYGQGLVKNSYVGRTFIEPSQTIRQRGIRLKLNPLRGVIAGQRVVVVDDSIVRGNTQQAIVTMLREAGAAEVHVRISSPPVSWPCFYGIDFATRAELIAGTRSVAEIRESIGADSLGFISQAGLTEANTVPADRLRAGCFDGPYPRPPRPACAPPASTAITRSQSRRRSGASTCWRTWQRAGRRRDGARLAGDAGRGLLLRRRGRGHRRRRPRRRADEGGGRGGRPGRGRRRHRRFRRPVRRQHARLLPAAPARHFHRRRG